MVEALSEHLETGTDHDGLLIFGGFLDALGDSFRASQVDELQLVLAVHFECHEQVRAELLLDIRLLDDPNEVPEVRQRADFFLAEFLSDEACVQIAHLVDIDFLEAGFKVALFS